jgi:hypothetical protein
MAQGKILTIWLMIWYVLQVVHVVCILIGLLGNTRSLSTPEGAGVAT